jgi:acyl carrier protein
MNQINIQARLLEVFVATLNDSTFQIEPALQKGDIDSWDSFAHINLMLAIESEFGVEFDSDEIATLLSIGQILEALNHRLEVIGKQ